MASIRLLAAPFDPPSLPAVSAEYMGVVPASRLALTRQASTRNDIASPDENFVWSAYAGSDGSFTFYAVPRKSSADDCASSQWGGFSQSLGILFRLVRVQRRLPIRTAGQYARGDERATDQCLRLAEDWPAVPGAVQKLTIRRTGRYASVSTRRHEDASSALLVF